MGLFTKDIKTMDDLLLHGLQDIYYAEQQITKALPKMIDKPTNRDLSNGLKNHLEETKRQIERLENVFAKLGKQPSGTQCPAIDGLIKEADEHDGIVRFLPTNLNEEHAANTKLNTVALRKGVNTKASNAA